MSFFIGSCRLGFRARGLTEGPRGTKHGMFRVRDISSVWSVKLRMSVLPTHKRKSTSEASTRSHVLLAADQTATVQQLASHSLT